MTDITLPQFIALILAVWWLLFVVVAVVAKIRYEIRMERKFSNMSDAELHAIRKNFFIYLDTIPDEIYRRACDELDWRFKRRFLGDKARKGK